MFKALDLIRRLRRGADCEREVQEILKHDYRPDEETLAEMAELPPCRQRDQLLVMQGLARLRPINTPRETEVLH